MNSLNVTILPTVLINAGNNDRKHFAAEALADLARSIAEKGLIQPITVRPIHDLFTGDTYEIVAGERRYRAISQILQWKEIPCIIRELSDEEASALMLAENTGRQDLNPMEESRSYQARISAFTWTVQHVAEVAGVSPARVNSRLKLLTLCPEAQRLVESNQLPLGHAEELARIDNNRQIIALRIYNAAKSMTLASFREVVNRLQAEQDQSGLFDLENFLTVQAVQDSEQPAKREKQVKVAESEYSALQDELARLREAVTPAAPKVEPVRLAPVKRKRYPNPNPLTPDTAVVKMHNERITLPETFKSEGKAVNWLTKRKHRLAGDYLWSVQSIRIVAQDFWCIVGEKGTFAENGLY